MRGFSFENHQNLKIEQGTGHILVAHLDLVAGSYLVWGKLSLGVNVESGYPPPPWPYATGAVSLALGSADDQAFFGVTPDAAQNNATINLMCGATIDRSRRARLYVINLYPLPIFCYTIRLIALQVDALAESEVGQDRQEAPQDEEERLRDAALRAKFRDGIRFSDLLRDR